MAGAIDDFRSSIVRRAICMEIGGFRPPVSPFACWFGRVNFASVGESWPTSDSKPMHALCQINLTDLPFRPPRLDDVEFISVFIGPVRLPMDTANGIGWCLRAYKSLNELVRLDPVQTGSMIKPFPMRPEVIEEDFPCREDLPCAVPPALDESYYDVCHNASGFKLGGWPSLVQSEIYWAPWNKHPISPEYVFQVDSTEKGNWRWGDNGVGYFGRGTVGGRTDDWAIDWQCY